MNAFAKRIDRNQPEIVSALRKAGVSVELTHEVGGGFPDLVCGVPEAVFLLELKDGDKPPSERKLTPDQVVWHARWRGPVHIVTSVAEALAVADSYRKRQVA